MSRHHILPPIVYMPAPPKPKETRRRRGVGYAGAAGEIEETGEASPSSAARAAAALPQHSGPVESAERKVHSPNGNLSDSTLKELLLAQEHDQDGAPRVVGTAPATEK